MCGYWRNLKKIKHSADLSDLRLNHFNSFHQLFTHTSVLLHISLYFLDIYIYDLMILCNDCVFNAISCIHRFIDTLQCIVIFHLHIAIFHRSDLLKLFSLLNIRVATLHSMANGEHKADPSLMMMMMMTMPVSKG